MKKLLLLLTLAAFIACNTEDEEGNKLSVTYNGTVTVTDNTVDGVPPYIQENAKYELAESGGLYKLTMKEIKFAAQMPALNITIPKLMVEDLDGDGVYTLRSTVDPIIPYIGDKPYEIYGILNFTGTLVDDQMTVRFLCKSTQMGLDHQVNYTGTAMQ
ncbi:hypothetical protein [uncultured Alistipes sp.]|jgi:lipoprotein|uniref:hypothetical protein n=1 Tax=uncultured Alistipes sp. TaxID=538949 RepID=UPI0025F5CF7F|nr:hypothetical protein [uncultured Alistipes sp.]